MNDIKFSDIISQYDVYFKKHGFSLSKKIWHKNCEDTIQIVEIYKSSWSKMIQIDFGIFIKRISIDFKSPSEHRSILCHLQSNPQVLIINEHERKEFIFKYCRFGENRQDMEFNVSSAIALFDKYEMLNYLDALSTLNGIIKHIESKKYYTVFQTAHFTAEQIYSFCISHTNKP